MLTTTVRKIIGDIEIIVTSEYDGAAPGIYADKITIDKIVSMANAVSGIVPSLSENTADDIELKYNSKNKGRLHRGSKHSAGLDICLCSSDKLFGGHVSRALNDGFYLKPLNVIRIETDLVVEVPEGFFLSIVPRSGMAIKNGITLINCMGVIDSDYRGNVSLGVINMSNDKFMIKPGMRVAQAILMRHNTPEVPTFAPVVNLSETERGKNGLGSTGE